MNAIKLFAAIVVLIIGSGCSTLQGVKLLAPEKFGLTSVSPDIYVETTADNETRLKLIEAVKNAERAVHNAYGNVISKPIIHACISDNCYKRFGGRGSTAKVYYDRIILSPRGLNWHFIAHEWSHAEMSSRLKFRAWLNLPQWFDEGVAVAISEAPEHSENHWQFLIENNILRPSTEELHSFRTLRQWINAAGRYGDSRNIERKAKGEYEIHPLYTAAGHELRSWLSKSGSTGLNRLIEQLNNGEKFDLAYNVVK